MRQSYTLNCCCALVVGSRTCCGRESSLKETCGWEGVCHNKADEVRKKNSNKQEHRKIVKEVVSGKVNSKQRSETW